MDRVPSRDSVAMAVYRGLLSAPDHGPDQLAQELGRPVAEVLVALRQLVDLGLLRDGPRRESDGPEAGDGPNGGRGDHDGGAAASDGTVTGAARLVNPGLALRPLVEAAERDVADRSERLQSLRHDVAAMDEHYRATREALALSQLERLDGVEAVVARLPELLDRVRSQVRTFVTLRPSYEALEQARRSDSALLERGVRVRTICLESVRSDRRFMAHLTAFHEGGAEIRTMATLPVRLLLLDDDVAVIAQDPQDPAVGAVVAHGKGLLATFSALFETYWEQANNPFGAAAAGTATLLSPGERGLVRLLAQGHKDETCARHLDVSVRTIRRMVADLTDRVGAGSRFELAVVAVRRGWV